MTGTLLSSLLPAVCLLLSISVTISLSSQRSPSDARGPAAVLALERAPASQCTCALGGGGGAPRVVLLGIGRVLFSAPPRKARDTYLHSHQCGDLADARAKVQDGRLDAIRPARARPSPCRTAALGAGAAAAMAAVDGAGTLRRMRLLVVGLGHSLRIRSELMIGLERQEGQRSS